MASSHASMGVPLSLWSTDAVRRWVAEQLADGLGGREQAAQYALSLKDAEVDGELLSVLTERDLEDDIGMGNPLHRRTILTEVAQLHGGGGQVRGGGVLDDARAPPPVRERPRVLSPAGKEPMACLTWTHKRGFAARRTKGSCTFTTRPPTFRRTVSRKSQRRFSLRSCVPRTRREQ